MLNEAVHILRPARTQATRAFSQCGENPHQRLAAACSEQIGQHDSDQQKCRGNTDGHFFDRHNLAKHYMGRLSYNIGPVVIGGFGIGHHHIPCFVAGFNDSGGCGVCSRVQVWHLAVTRERADHPALIIDNGYPAPVGDIYAAKQ
ncbi:hypothetical protein D3C73_927750 [compost metagenome]